MKKNMLLSFAGVFVAGLAICSCTSSKSPGAEDTAGTTSMTLAGGTVGVAYPPIFGLAVAGEKILVTSYIPPCSEGYAYCLYLDTGEYQGTNFESAGLAITLRKDLTSESACLTTPPDGFVGLTPVHGAPSTPATGVFSPLGDAGAGHYANGADYRLFARGACYELETRIGETQFANFPTGAVRKFTDADRIKVRQELRSVIDSVTVDGKPVTFPEAPEREPAR
jgi:hypothetical protein